MTDNSIGMGKQDRSERDKFEGELKRIIKASDEAGILLRVIGSLAFQMHCPEHGYLQEAMGRAYTDIDFAAYRKQTKEIKELMSNLGYTENREVFIVSEGERSIFDRPEIDLHVDVFYEKLDFCHTIYWADRLEVDGPTIPLAELLLEKMQIVKINEKDVIDTIMLLLEHPLGDNDTETINIKRIAELCSTDWGLWRTTTMSIPIASRFLAVSRSVSPLLTELVFFVNSMISALNLFAARAKLFRVRVLSSKNRFTTTFPRRGGAFLTERVLTCSKPTAVSRI